MKTYLVILSIVIVLLFVLLIFLRIIPSEAIFGFLGVFVGSIIASTAQFIVADANIKQQYRLAALDKRLQAHQEAFEMWRRLLQFCSQQTEENFQLILDCKNWWNNNSLYLSKNARDAFKKAYIAAEYLSQPPQVQAGTEARKKDLEVLERAGEIIVEGVGLPPIGEDKP